MKKKLILFIFLIILLVIFAIFEYKKKDWGNNISEIDILNISSYEALVEVTVYSNKNVNKYIMKQEYKEPNFFNQEIIEPNNLKGLTITNNGENVTIENGVLGLKNVYEDFNRRCFKFKFNKFYK